MRKALGGSKMQATGGDLGAASKAQMTRGNDMDSASKFGAIRRVYRFCKPYVLYACVALLAISVAILPLSYSYINIKFTINLIFAALGLFVVFYARDLRLSELKAIWIPLAAFSVVVIMAYISLFWAADTKGTLKAIRQYLLEPGLIMLGVYLIIKRLDSRGLWFLCIALFLALSYHPFATIYDFFSSEKFAKYGFGILGWHYRAMLNGYYVPPTVYVFYLVFSLGFALALCVFTRGFWKFASFLLPLINLGAIVANGGRFALLAAFAVLFSPFVLCAYRYKKIILSGLFAIFVVLLFGLYQVSEKWGERYNFHDMTNHFAEVWETPPAEMGKFWDKCNVWSQFCSPHSLNKSADFAWELSSLLRISMLKTTILAIAENPLRPNGYHFQQFYKNLERIFPKDSESYIFTYIHYAHNHIYILSFWFELGLIGFLGVVFFVLYLYKKYKDLYIPLSYTKQNDLNLPSLPLASGIIFGFSGLIVANFFDCIPVRDGNLVLFILFGIVLALILLMHQNANSQKGG